jgi:cytochrome P450
MSVELGSDPAKSGASMPELAEEVAAWFECREDIVANPYPLFKRMQSEAPIFRDDWKVALTRYDDCKAIALDNSLWKELDALPESETEGYSADDLEILRQLWAMEHEEVHKTEGPTHSRIRGLIRQAFTPRAVDAWRSRMETIVDDLLDRAAGGSQFELMSDFALELPLMVVCEMLDIPVEDRHMLHEADLARSAFFAGPMHAASPDTRSRVLREAHANKIALREYLNNVIDERRRAPRDSHSLLSRLIDAEEQGGKLTTSELIATMSVLIFAGHETTTNAIGNLIVALMHHRDQWEMLLANPELLPNAIEEILRWNPPVQVDFRYAQANTVVSDVSVFAGDRVLLLWAAANRDPSGIADADVFDISRGPNSHLGFGVGRHFCLGASLSRLETTVAMERLMVRFPRMHLRQDTIAWRPLWHHRGAERIDLELST